MEPFRQVFEACEPDEYGFISLKNLGNISRSHVESSDVDRILQIFDNAQQDRLNFSEFCDYINKFMLQAKDKENLTPPETSPTNHKMDQNENPSKMNPHIQISSSDPPEGIISPSKDDNQRMLGANLSHKRKMSRKNSRSRATNSQTKLTGQIPLVNTSSEDEIDLEEDSFDRRIAQELEFAGKQLESASRIPARTSPPRFLVRGSNSRSTLRSKSSGRLPFAPLVITESPKMNMLSPIMSAETSIDQPQNFDDSVSVSPRMNSKLSLASPYVGDKLSRHSSPIARSVNSDVDDDSMRYDVDSLESKVNLVATKQIVDQLENQLNTLQANDKSVDRFSEKSAGGFSYKSAGGFSDRSGDRFSERSGGRYSGRNGDVEHDSVPECDLIQKINLEEEIERIRAQANENIQYEREIHRDEIRAMKKERELEINNYKLRLEQLQTEVDRLTKEKTDLQEKVGLLFMEKESSEETMLKLQEDMIKLEDENKYMEDKVRETMSKDSTRDRISEVSKMSLGSDQMSTTESYENEYLVKIQQMVARIQQQDDQITELKEDNLVLRNQKKSLLDNFNSESKWKRSFLGVRNRSFSNANDLTINLGLDTDDPQDIRVRTSSLHSQLAEQTEMNSKLKKYLDEVLISIMMKNPDILEKSTTS